MFLRASHLFGPGTHLFKTSSSDPLSWTEIHQSRTKDYGGLYCWPASSVLNRARSQSLSNVCKVLHKHSQSIHTGPHFPLSYHPLTARAALHFPQAPPFLPASLLSLMLPIPPPPSLSLLQFTLGPWSPPPWPMCLSHNSGRWTTYSPYRSPLTIPWKNNHRHTKQHLEVEYFFWVLVWGRTMWIFLIIPNTHVFGSKI